jgi:hypothetical protein
LVAAVAVIAAFHLLSWWTSPPENDDKKKKTPASKRPPTHTSRLLAEPLPEDLVPKEEAEEEEMSEDGREENGKAEEGGTNSGREEKGTTDSDRPKGRPPQSPAERHRRRRLQRRRVQTPSEEAASPREEGPHSFPAKTGGDEHPGLGAFHRWCDAEAGLFRIYVVAGGTGGSIPPYPTGSRRGTVPLQLEVTNALEETLYVDWVNYRGRPENRGTVPPGGTWTQITWIDHPWVFRTAVGRGGDDEEESVLLHYIPYRVIPSVQEAPTVGSDGRTGVHRFTIREADLGSDDRCAVDDPVLPHPASRHILTPTAAASWAVLHCRRMGYDGWRVLAKYLTNIVSHPAEPKYRRIRTANAKFNQAIWSTPARGLLLAAGFVEHGAYCELGCDEPLSRDRVQDLALLLFMVERAAARHEKTQGFGRAGALNRDS